MPGAEPGKVEFKKIRTFVDDIDERAVQYEGVALKRKDPTERQIIASRIAAMNVDVLAVQEVEDIETLRYFVRHELGGSLYPHLILVEGNDPRLIDLAVLSKYPIGEVTTWQHAVHPDDPSRRVFSRDLLQVEILNPSRTRRLLTVFNSHLKSHYVPFTNDQEQGAAAGNQQRKRQAEMTAKIITHEMDADDRFIVLGDFNDPVDSEFLQPLTKAPRLGLVNGLAHATETQACPSSSSPAPSTAWTHRYKPSGKPAEYALFDQIWLSPSLARAQTNACIDRRTKLSGDGSDHDPAWTTFNL